MLAASTTSPHKSPLLRLPGRSERAINRHFGSLRYQVGIVPASGALFQSVFQPVYLVGPNTDAGTTNQHSFSCVKMAWMKHHIIQIYFPCRH